jgi:hypothetical protein
MTVASSSLLAAFVRGKEEIQRKNSSDKHCSHRKELKSFMFGEYYTFYIDNRGSHTVCNDSTLFNVGFSGDDDDD